MNTDTTVILKRNDLSVEDILDAPPLGTHELGLLLWDAALALEGRVYGRQAESSLAKRLKLTARLYL